ncbi:MAG: ribbon-helix-helix domain-containing protein [Thermoplasmata archaeon]
MRTTMTITIDYELKKQLKELSLETGIPISQFIESALNHDQKLQQMLQQMLNDIKDEMI